MFWFLGVGCLGFFYSFCFEEFFLFVLRGVLVVWFCLFFVGFFGWFDVF